MKITFDGIEFESKNEVGLRLRLTKYINSTYGSLEEYFKGNKCAFSDNYSKVKYSFIDGHVVFDYAVGAHYCGKCRCKTLNPVSKEFLKHCRGMSDDQVLDFLSAKGKKSLDTSMNSPTPSAVALAKMGQNPVSKNELLKRFDDIDEVNQYLSDKSKRSIDTKRQNGFFDDKSNNPFSKDYWIKKGLSIDEAQRKVNSRNFWCEESNIDIKNPAKIEYWVDKYGEEEGKLRYDDKNRRIGLSQSKTGLIQIHGEEIGLAKYYYRYSQNGLHKTSKSHSKPAKQFFVKLYKRLRKAGFSRDDFNFGVRGSYEFTLRDNTIKEWNRYDFCLLSKKIIIEYNGSIWHPRLNRMSREQYDMWRMPWHPTVTAYEKEHKDMEKHKFAIDRGYEILEVWDTDDVDKALQFCFERIMS